MKLLRNEEDASYDCQSSLRHIQKGSVVTLINVNWRHHLQRQGKRGADTSLEAPDDANDVRIEPQLDS
jgi:hypothetical protein